MTFCEVDPQIKKSKIEKNRFSQNRSKIGLGGQYGFKTCLGHLGDSFHTIYHDFEQFKTIFQKLILCQKSDFLQFLAVFDLGPKYRLFAQKS